MEGMKSLDELGDMAQYCQSYAHFIKCLNPLKVQERTANILFCNYWNNSHKDRLIKQDELVQVVGLRK